MTVQRVTDLSAPPVVGQWYLVPTVFFGWGVNDSPRAWPVFLPRHEDARFFNFADEHYHIDPRFVDKRGWRSAGPEEDGPWGALAYLQRAPIARKRHGRWTDHPPQPVWARRKCHRANAPYQHGHVTAVLGLRDHYAGQTCRHNRNGWVCPHQNWPMGSLEPDADGVLTCPLHGLKVRASDGFVLPTAQAEAVAAALIELQELTT